MSATRLRRRILLRQDVDATSVLVECEALGLFPKEFYDADVTRPFEIVFHGDPTNFVRFIDNHQLGVRIIDVEGPGAIEIARDLEARLPHYNGDRVLDAAEVATDVDMRMQTLYHVALMAPSLPEERIVRLVANALGSAEPRLRGAAVLAIGYIGWPQLADLLRPVATSDPDSSVRADAELLLSRMNQLRSGVH